MGNIEINKDGRGMMKLEGLPPLRAYDLLGISIRTSADKVYDVITGTPSSEIKLIMCTGQPYTCIDRCRWRDRSLLLRVLSYFEDFVN